MLVHVPRGSSSAGLRVERTPGGSSVLPGEGVVDQRLVDEAVREINRVITTRLLEVACEVGRYVLDVFFGGDVEHFRRRGRDHQSFRALAEREELQYSGIWLWRAVSVYAQLDQLPENVARALPYSHHTVLLTLPKAEDKVVLATAAVDGSWTRDRLQAEVARLRGSAKRGVGRPPLLPLVKTLHRIETLLDDDSLSGVDGLDGMDPDEQRRLHRSLRRMLRKLEALAEELQPLSTAP